MEKEILDIQKVIDDCSARMIKIGIPVKKNVGFSKLSTKIKNTVAMCCHFERTNIYIIQFDYNYIKKHANTSLVNGLVCHELIHTIDDCKEHNKKFKEYADMVENVYGWTPMRNLTIRDMYTQEDPVAKVVCPVCGMYTMLYRDQLNEKHECSQDNVEMKKILL